MLFRVERSLCLLGVFFTISTQDSDNHHNPQGTVTMAPKKLAITPSPSCIPSSSTGGGGEGALKILPKGVPPISRQFLVSTLDGRLTLLGDKGEEVWALDTGLLFSSTISSLQLIEHGKWVNLIPSLTGGLYKYDEENLFPMSINVDALLHKSFKLSNEVVMNGGKEIRTLGIDLRNGRTRYECGLAGCSPPEDEDTLGGEPPSSDVPTLIVKKHIQTVRALDTLTGTEKWNFSVGLHELGLAKGEGTLDENAEDEEKIFKFIKVGIPEGLLLGMDPSSGIVWERRFSSPIAQAWVLETGGLKGHRLRHIDPLLHSPLRDGPLALYVGKVEGQWYVQESMALSHRMDGLLGGRPPHKDLPISWKPSLQMIEEATDGPACGEAGGSTALSPFRPSSSLRPFYVLEEDEIYTGPDGAGPLALPPSTSTSTMAPALPPLEDLLLHQGEGDWDEDEDETITIILISSLWVWWKEVLGISLLLAVTLNILLMRPIVRAVRMQTIRDVVRFFMELRRERGIQDGEVIPRDGQGLLSLPPGETSGQGVADVEDDSSPRVSVSESYVEHPAEPIVPTYVSQYLREFEPIECLGKGGFGVVFEARKKIDDRHYAVKRIQLPWREDARDRVLREVKALASLDHRGIVRYFNAWIENPPPNWMEANDPLFNLSPDLKSPTPSLHLCQQSPPLRKRGARGNRKRRSPTNEVIKECDINPVDDTGSYIVFAADGDAEEVRQGEITSGGGDGSWYNKDEGPPPPLTKSSVGGGGFWRVPTDITSLESVPCPATSFSNENGISSWACLNDHDPQGDFDISISHMNEGGISIGEEALEGKEGAIMYLYIQQELCQKRTLRDWLKGVRKEERTLRRILSLKKQLVDAVDYVHSKKLIHRDLKPSNIFLASCEGEEEEVLKIGDFGLATTVVTQDKGSSLSTPRDGNKGQVNLTSQVGTELYMSPEQFKRKSYSYKVDIYSLGLIFFELLTPFSTEMERHSVLSQLKRTLQVPPHFQEEFPQENAVILQMISENPDVRPDAPFLSNWVKGRLKTLEEEGTLKDTPRSNSSPAHINRTNSSSSSNSNNSQGEGTLPLRPPFSKSHSFTSF